MLFDTHAHLNDERYRDDLDVVLERSVNAGVDRILIASYDLDSSRSSVELASKINGGVCSVGLHPHDAVNFNDEILDEIGRLALSDRTVVKAIGEIGLDYHYDDPPAELQKTAFRRQIELAHECDLPIIIHDREAHHDILEIISEAKKSGLFRQDAGVFHCYSGSAEMAETIIKAGFYVSFAGPVTFKNAKRTVEVMSKVPIERILVETDCPYLAPEPHRGTRNEPAYVRYVAEKLAEVKGMTYEDAAQITTMNACRLFGI